MATTESIEPRAAKSFRLSAESVRTLTEWSETSGLSRATIIEMLIKEAKTKGRRPSLSIVEAGENNGD